MVSEEKEDWGLESGQSMSNVQSHTGEYLVGVVNGVDISNSHKTGYNYDNIYKFLVNTGNFHLLIQYIQVIYLAILLNMKEQIQMIRIIHNLNGRYDLAGNFLCVKEQNKWQSHVPKRKQQIKGKIK